MRVRQWRVPPHHLPEGAANLTFGGLARNRLFITATTSLYSIRINVNGAAPRTV